ncbi:MAG: hypothetical protein LC789_12625 [Actinobacteria bacterium]|nr:hypothetical protein [Actinomycetota bacterium]MCA1721938.1 hypothetical protein [Actinomycetota bacterium]
MTLRTAVEKRSAPVLVLLSQQPRVLVPVLALLLLIGGLALPAAFGAVCLVLLLAFVGWLTYLSWPVIVGQARLLRYVTLALILAALLSRLRDI